MRWFQAWVRQVDPRAKHRRGARTDRHAWCGLSFRWTRQARTRAAIAAASSNGTLERDMQQW